ncbi:MAG TPA: hypothetical protein VGO40_23140 [Longimicrobium sp.]|jgi:hypothetical protein|nr:hypothetical protein [Longimicrobium sp.]
MPSLRRVFASLPLLAVGAALASLPAASQGPHADAAGAAPLLHGVARLSCGTPMPRSYTLASPGLRPAGSGTYAPSPQRALLRSAELVGTLELTFGGEPRRGTADAERPPAGSWTATQLGYCTGGRGPLHLAVITPAADGHPARFELRGPASRIQRPGERALPEGGEVRFLGTCGRRKQVVMEIWPPALVDAGQARPEPERYYLVGTITCAAAGTGAAAADTTPTATP